MKPFKFRDWVLYVCGICWGITIALLPTTVDKMLAVIICILIFIILLLWGVETSTP